MSLEARNWARRIGGLSIAAKAVLMALADHADAEGKAWMPVAAKAASPAASSSVPAALREAAALRKGAGWTASWLAPCRYDAIARVLHARTAFAAKIIASELGGLLRDLEVSLAPVMAS